MDFFYNNYIAKVNGISQEVDKCWNDGRNIEMNLHFKLRSLVASIILFFTVKHLPTTKFL